MENPNSDMHDWDWEAVPISDDEHLRLHSTHTPSLADRPTRAFRFDHFSIQLENPTLLHPVNHHLGLPDHIATDHSAESSEIAQNNSDSEVGVYSLTDHFEKSSDEFRNSVEVELNSVAGFSDHLEKSSQIVQNNETSEVEINSLTVAKSSEIIVQNSGNKYNDVETNSLTVSSDHLAKSSANLQSSGIIDEGELNSLTGFCDESSKIVQFSRDDDVEHKQEQHGDCLDLVEKNEIENEKKRVVSVWWKVPLEVLKYCILRVSPVWSISMAAATALMGFVILRRRYLYKMKRKSMNLQLSVSVHDKKVSQLMSRAARLNEAFAVVKRVPIIRPALPAPGVVTWPVMSLR